MAPNGLAAAIRGNPAAIQQRAQPDTVRGLDALENLVSAGATQVSVDGLRISQLTDPVPSLENGLWQILSDGRMTMTWRIRPGLHWHDGAPLTSEDFVFATMVEQDREAGIPRWAGYDLVEGITAPDPLAITVVWK